MCRLPSDLLPPLRTEPLRPRLTSLLAALAGELNRRWVTHFNLISDLSGSDVAYQLGEGEGITGALQALGWHAWNLACRTGKAKGAVRAN